MMNLKKIMIGLIILYVNLIFWFGGYLVVQYTVKGEFEKAVEETADLKDSFKYVWHQRKNRYAYETQQRELVERLTALKAQLPDLVSKSQIKHSIYKRAENNSLNVTKYGYVSIREIEFYTEHNLVLSLTGTYKNIVSYLYELQTGNSQIVATSDFSLLVMPNNAVEFEGKLRAYEYILYGADEAYEQLVNEYKDYDEAR